MGWQTFLPQEDIYFIIAMSGGGGGASTTAAVASQIDNRSADNVLVLDARLVSERRLGEPRTSLAASSNRRQDSVVVVVVVVTSVSYWACAACGRLDASESVKWRSRRQPPRHSAEPKVIIQPLRRAASSTEIS